MCKDVRPSRQASEGLATYSLTSRGESFLSQQSASFGHAARQAETWLLKSKASGELKGNPSTPQSHPSPRFNPPPRSPRSRADMSEVRGELLIHAHNDPGDTTPGPASYNIPRTKVPAPVISWTPRKMGMSALPTKMMQSPGPGDYQSAQAWHDRDWDKGAKFAVLSPRSSEISSPLCRGDIFVHSSKSQKQTPGPGAYYRGVKESTYLQRQRSAAGFPCSPLSPAGLGSARSSSSGAVQRGYMQATASSKRKEKGGAAARCSSTGALRRMPSGPGPSSEPAVESGVESALL